MHIDYDSQMIMLMLNKRNRAKEDASYIGKKLDAREKWTTETLLSE